MGVLQVRAIQSFADDPALAPYGSMRRMQEHREAGIFVAEGHQVVERLLRSPLPVESLLLPPPWFERLRPLIQARPEPEIKVFLAHKALLETLTGFELYQGVLAVGRTPAPLSVETLLRSAGRPAFLLAIDGVTSADNMGQLVRTAAAFAVQGIIASNTSCSVWLRRTVRTSMGAVFQMPVVEHASLPESLALLKAQGIRIVAAHPHTDKRLLSEAVLTGDVCLLVGSEGHGISPETLRLADECAAVPMSAGVDSLNVNAATAVFLYEAARQRSRS
ncbi:MAG TPA: RNA methyltransferase [Methylomirabilota bacterium]|nr:RNA methyltransferase [Methylomirabilota bacterium]